MMRAWSVKWKTFCDDLKRLRIESMSDFYYCLSLLILCATLLFCYSASFVSTLLGLLF